MHRPNGRNVKCTRENARALHPGKRLNLIYNSGEVSTLPIPRCAFLHNKNADIKCFLFHRFVRKFPTRIPHYQTLHITRKYIAIDHSQIARVVRKSRPMSVEQFANPTNYVPISDSLIKLVSRFASVRMILSKR